MALPTPADKSLLRRAAEVCGFCFNFSLLSPNMMSYSDLTSCFSTSFGMDRFGTVPAARSVDLCAVGASARCRRMLEIVAWIRGAGYVPTKFHSWVLSTRMCHVWCTEGRRCLVSRYVWMRAEFVLIAAELENSLRSHDKLWSRNVCSDIWNMSQQRGNAVDQSVSSKRGASLEKCRLSLVLEINIIMQKEKEKKVATVDCTSKQVFTHL